MSYFISEASWLHKKGVFSVTSRVHKQHACTQRSDCCQACSTPAETPGFGPKRGGTSSQARSGIGVLLYSGLRLRARWPHRPKPLRTAFVRHQRPPLRQPSLSGTRPAWPCRRGGRWGGCQPRPHGTPFYRGPLGWTSPALPAGRPSAAPTPGARSRSPITRPPSAPLLPAAGAEKRWPAGGVPTPPSMPRASPSSEPLRQRHATTP